MTRRLAAPLATLLLLVGAVACGSGGSPDEVIYDLPATPPPTVTTTTKRPGAPAGQRR